MNKNLPSADISIEFIGLSDSLQNDTKHILEYLPKGYSIDVSGGPYTSTLAIFHKKSENGLTISCTLHPKKITLQADLDLSIAGRPPETIGKFHYQDDKNLPLFYFVLSGMILDFIEHNQKSYPALFRIAKVLNQTALREAREAKEMINRIFQPQ